MRMTSTVGAMVSFQEGSELLQELVGVVVDAKQVERTAEALEAVRLPSFVDRVFRELAISKWSDSQQANEGSPHHVQVAETRGRGHLFEASPGTFQLSARGFHTSLKHILRRCCAYLSSKDALEVSHAH